MRKKDSRPTNDRRQTRAPAVLHKKLNQTTEAHPSEHRNTETFEEAMRQHGLTPPQDIVPGRFYRFPGCEKKRGSTAGWCRKFSETQGVFGDWSTGLKENWRASGNTRYFGRSEEERLAQQQRILRQRDERQRAHQATSMLAINLIAESSPAKDTHPYLVQKQVKSYGLHWKNDHLLIPLCDNTSKVWTIQSISPDGRKRFLKNGKLKGNYYLIGSLAEKSTVLVCEGYATAATLYERFDVPVVVAFNSTNLTPVSKAIRAIAPRSKLIICGDNDRHTSGNPGVTKAREAALAVGGSVSVPNFSDTEDGTDWNDWFNNREVQF